MIVIGDSHTECAIDDGIFTQAANISDGGTAFIYSYGKLRRFLDENEHIDTVLLSFHYAPLLKGSGNAGVLGNKSILGHLPLYFFLMGKNEYFVFQNNSLTVVAAIARIPVKNIRAILKFFVKRTILYNDLHIGGYNRLDRNKLYKDIALQEHNNNSTITPGEYSPYQLLYLQKIAGLCAERNVELILFNAPTYNPAKYGRNDELLAYYHTYLDGIKYMDYSGFPLPESGYGDIGHLNYKGAEIFSRYLEENFAGIFLGE
jgi:hypothetical protein